MKCTGRVVDNLGNTARVLLETGACGECRACGIASMRERKSLEVIAFNSIGAQEGDIVNMEASGRRVVSASAILFMLPFSAFITGFSVCYLATSHILRPGVRPLISLLCGFLFLCTSFVLVRILGNKFEGIEFVIISFESPRIAVQNAETQLSQEAKGEGKPSKDG